MRAKNQIIKSIKHTFWIVVALLPIFIFGCTSPTRASQVEVKKNVQEEWNLIVDGKPFFIRGISYIVNKVGHSPNPGYGWTDWAFHDYNNNNRIDGPYDSWVDSNRNNRKDPDEAAIGDFQLMKELGVNTIRWYVNAFPNQKPNPKLLRDLFKNYGIRVAVGDYFGSYCIGSEAVWEDGTDYRDPVQRQKMLDSVRRMVQTHKDEPYVLLWLLGNENNYPFTKTNASTYPEAYAKFLNKAALLIHELDGKHPVALVNGEDNLLKYYAKFAPAIDIFGTNSYKGPFGFGSIWNNVKNTYDKPVLITEYGGNESVDEAGQMSYHRGCWGNIQKNGAGGSGAGNAIGGMAFEWLDRWWTGGEPFKHAKMNLNIKPGATNWNQEYAGFAAQGNGSQSPFMRQLRKVYFLYKNELWNNRN